MPARSPRAGGRSAPDTAPGPPASAPGAVTRGDRAGRSAKRSRAVHPGAQPFAGQVTWPTRSSRDCRHVLERMLGRADVYELDWMTSAAPDPLLAANGGVDVVTADLVL